MNLFEFIDSPLRNLWIDEPGIAYYVRKSIMFRGAIDLANCGQRPTGQFGFYRFIKRYGSTIPFFMEQVFNPDICQYMLRLGWTEIDRGGVPQFASPLFMEQFSDNRFLLNMLKSD